MLIAGTATEHLKWKVHVIIECTGRKYNSVHTLQFEFFYTSFLKWKEIKLHNSFTVSYSLSIVNDLLVVPVLLLQNGLPEISLIVLVENFWKMQFPTWALSVWELLPCLKLRPESYSWTYDIAISSMLSSDIEDVVVVHFLPLRVKGLKFYSFASFQYVI